MVGDPAALLDDGDGAGHVPGRAPARVGVDHRSEEVRARLLDDLDLLVRPHAGQPLAVVLELAVEAEHELGRHPDLDGEVGGRGQLLHRLQHGEELGVAGRGGGVEVDAVAAHLGHHARDVEHVVLAGPGHRHLRLARGLDLAAREQVGRVGERPVRLRVEAEVGHRPVEHGDDRGEQRLLDADRLEGDDRLDRLVGVIRVADLHGVEAEGALEDAEALLARQADAHAAGELRRVERVDRAVLGQDDLVAGLHAHDAAGVGEQVDQPVDLVLLERRDLAALHGVGRTGLEVVAQLLRRELGHVTVAHARADGAHLSASSPGLIVRRCRARARPRG